MTASPSQYRAHVSSESSFLHSLASIHKDTPLSRRASLDEGRRSESKAPRLASGSAALPHGAANHHRSSTHHGILRTHEDPSAAVFTPSQNRVSFARQPDEPTGRLVSNSYDIHASSRQTSAPRSIGREKSPSPQAASRPSRPSLKASKASMPPLPIRPSSSSNPDKNLAAVLAKGSAVRLPFSTNPVATSHRQVLHEHSFSMLDVDQVQHSFSMLDVDQGTRSSSPSSVASFSSHSSPQRRYDTAAPARPATQAHHRHYQGQNIRAVCASRTDYKLGELARSPSHMVIDHNPSTATLKVSTLKNYDFAFIKRTDGSWTYAILAYRSNDDDDDDQEECMMFVMNAAGSTKVIKRHQWAEYVRCVAVLEEENAVPCSIDVKNEEDCSLVTLLS